MRSANFARFGESESCCTHIPIHTKHTHTHMHRPRGYVRVEVAAVCSLHAAYAGQHFLLFTLFALTDTLQRKLVGNYLIAFLPLGVYFDFIRYEF